MPPEVLEAMTEASLHFVSMGELHEKVGRRIAELIGVQAAAVTSGAAGAIAMGTAACVTGGDPLKARRLPDTAGMKNRVVTQKSHRMYEAQIRLVGAEIVEIETTAELDATVGSDTAMLFFANTADVHGQIKREEWVAAGKRYGVPTFCDAAADVPPVERLSTYVNMGFDLVAFSGGKGMRGPQNAGLLLGRPDLVDAARAHGSVWDGIGRGMKVGKEEVMGLLAAVERFIGLDHKAERDDLDRRVEVIAAVLSGMEGVRTEVYVPEIANHVPHLAVAWDPGRIALSSREVTEQLRTGDPAIEVGGQNAWRSGDSEVPDWQGLTVSVWTLRSGEPELVARRLREILGAGGS